NVIHIIPGQAPNYPADLMLPKDAAAVQQKGGTWSEMFNTAALINRYPGLGAVGWYLAILVLGLLVYPILRIAMKGLPDLGYPLAKMAGLLLLAWLVWMASSSGLSFSRGSIWIGAGLLGTASLALAIWQRGAIRAEIKQRWRYYL